MRPFRSYLETDEVRRIQPDPMLARGLRKDSDERLLFFGGKPVTGASAKILLENLYDAVRARVEAVLAENGYKSYSHVATLTYARENGLVNETEAIYLERLRERRNEAKYDGSPVSVAEAEEASIKLPLMCNKL